MKQIALGIIIGLNFMFTLKAQNIEKYSRVKVNIEGKDIRTLESLGLEVDHGVYIPNHYLINEFSQDELTIIKRAGFDYQVQIDDIVANLLAENAKHQAESRNVGDCDQNLLRDTHKQPINFKLGSMAGYYTYEEAWAEIDLMRAKYPGLISTYSPIDTFKTHSGKPIRWLRISDNPNQDEAAEPEVLYTAVHHAREVLGVSQMIYFMWYILENYNQLPEIKQLLDNTALYFVPFVNPDGYIFNQTTKPNGGGFWRKNRRDNKDGTFGVDLNRNYGYEWGISNDGSSPSSASDTYRGPAPFSEPELKAIKAFCEKRNFKVALNYHTFGNLLIYPWGFNDQLADPGFREIADIMTQENRFKSGTGIETVAYNVNGDSDDWMWGARRIYALTPEASTDGFWPVQTKIRYLCSDLLHMNLRTAQLVGAYAEVKPANLPTFLTTTGQIAVNVKRYGFDNQPFNLTLTPLSTSIISKQEVKTITLNQFLETDVTFTYALKSTLKSGEPARWLLKTQSANGSFVKYDTIRSSFGGVTVLQEKGENLGNWFNLDANPWGITSKQFKSAPSCMTDSPNGLYKENTRSSLISKNYISIPNKKRVILRFWAKWDLEKEVDYVSLSIKDKNSSYSYACGKFTRLGAFLQLGGEPIYDGASDWVLEEIDISQFAGEDILLNFTIATDYQNNRDGFYIDDIEIIAEDLLATTNVINLTEDTFITNANPNPAQNFLTVNIEQPIQQAVLNIYDIIGNVVQKIDINTQQFMLDIGNLTSGTYIYQVSDAMGKKSEAKRFVKF